MILFVNACVRKNSRTKRLAECLLSRIPGEIRELRLSEIAFPVTDEAFLEKRDRLTAKSNMTIRCLIWPGSLRRRIPL